MSEKQVWALPAGMGPSWSTPDFNISQTSRELRLRCPSSPFVHGAGTSPSAERPSREQAHPLLAAASTAQRLRQSRSPCRTSACHLHRLTWAPSLPAWPCGRARTRYGERVKERMRLGRMRLPQGNGARSLPQPRARAWDWWGRGGLEGGGRSEGRRRKSSPCLPPRFTAGGRIVGGGWKGERSREVAGPAFSAWKGQSGNEMEDGKPGEGGGGNPRLCSPQGPTLGALTFWRIWPEVETLRMSFCGEPDSCSGSLSDDSSAVAVGAAAVAPAWGCEAPATAAAAAAAMLHGEEQGGQRHLAPQAAPCKRQPCVGSAAGERSRQAGWPSGGLASHWPEAAAHPVSGSSRFLFRTWINKRSGFSVRWLKHLESEWGRVINLHL